MAEELTPAQRRQKLLLERHAAQIEKDKNSSKKTSGREAFSCDICGKTFSSQNAYKNHCDSRKHKFAEMALREALQKSGETRSVQDAVIGGCDPSDSEEVRTVDDNNVSTESSPEQEGWDTVNSELFKAMLEGREVTSQEELGLIWDHVVSKRPGIPQFACPFCSYDITDASEESLNAPELPAHFHMGFDYLRRDLGQMCDDSESDDEDIDMPPVDAPLPSLGPHFRCLWEHMTTAHNLVIPKRNCLVDAAGLVAFLQEKVGRWYACVKCHKMHKSLPGVRQHMEALGHIQLQVDVVNQGDEQAEGADFTRFFDFSRDFDEDVQARARHIYRGTLRHALKDGDLDEETARYVAEDEMWNYLQSVRRSMAPLRDSQRGVIVLYSGTVVQSKQTAPRPLLVPLPARREDRPTPQQQSRALMKQIAFPFTLDTHAVRRELARYANVQMAARNRASELEALAPRPGFKNQHIYLI